MPNLLKPHSKEWFKKLEKLNPVQAAQTRQLISMAGTDSVCSICGDDPAQDYKLVRKQATPDMVLTFKLCNDCLDTHRTMHGEKIVPLSN